jgi:hypothetical protein
VVYLLMRLCLSKKARRRLLKLWIKRGSLQCSRLAWGITILGVILPNAISKEMSTHRHLWSVPRKALSNGRYPPPLDIQTRGGPNTVYWDIVRVSFKGRWRRSTVFRENNLSKMQA